MVNFEKLDNELNTDKISEGRLETGEAIQFGSERNWGSGKTFIDVFIQGETRERSAGKYVAKMFTNKSEALKEVYKCIKLSEAGIPVPPTHRFSEINGKYFIIYTDLTNNGANEVWSANNFLEQDVPFNTTTKEIESIEKKLENITVLAANNRFRICSDAYFLVRKPDGGIEVIIGDLGIGVAEWSKGNVTNILTEINSVESERFVEYIREKSKPFTS